MVHTFIISPQQFVSLVEDLKFYIELELTSRTSLLSTAGQRQVSFDNYPCDCISRNCFICLFRNLVQRQLNLP